MEVLKLVVHTADNTMKTVVLSKKQINLNHNEALDHYIIKFYKRLKNSAAISQGILHDTSVLKQYVGVQFDFMAVSTQLAQEWFDHYEGSTTHTACNLVFALIATDEGVEYVMFEVMSRSGFFTVTSESENNIEHNQGILSDSFASVKAAFTFDLNNGDLWVKHTPATQDYLETMLDIDIIPNAKKSIEIMNAVVDYMAIKRDDDVLGKGLKTKQLVLETAELFEEIEPKRIINQVFETLDETELDFVNTSFEENNMAPLIESKNVTRMQSLKKLRIKTDYGIEIVIPIDSLNPEEILEVEELPNNQVNIKLKNVGKIV